MPVRTLLPAAAVLAAGVAALPAAVPAAETRTAAYSITWAGLEVGAVAVELTRDGDAYDVRYEARTVGLVGSLWPFSATGASEGRLGGDGLAAARHGGQSRWDDSDRVWRIAFAPDGRATEIVVPANDAGDREPVPEPLRVGPDPLSLALMAIEAARPGLVLDGRSFDGRRVLDLQLRCGGADGVVPASTGAEGAGPLLCAVDGQLVAGASKRWRDRPQEPRPPTQVRLERGVLGAGWWPVEIEASSRWGTITATLVEPAVGG